MKNKYVQAARRKINTESSQNVPKIPAAAFPIFFSAIPEQYPEMNPYESCVGIPESMASCAYEYLVEGESEIGMESWESWVLIFFFSFLLSANKNHPNATATES